MSRLKRSFVWAFLALAALSLSTMSQAQSGFTGTWRFDLSKSKFSDKPFIFYTSQGWFHCETCSTPMDIQADGQDHPSADGAFDAVNVTVVDDHTVHFVGKKGGKAVLDVTETVSADGKTLMTKTIATPSNGGTPATNDNTSKRDGKLPAGVHPTSGRWIATKQSGNDNSLLITLKVNGDQVEMTDPLGESYTAKLDGTDATVNGSIGWDSVSMKKINDNTIEETDKFKGKVTGIQKWTVSANGKTLTQVSTEKPSDRVSTFVATKQ